MVVNFLNRNNEADQRVFQILSEKFRLFEGVFGASDEVLGSIESGVDFEKRIAEIYQHCRQPEEIKAAFDRLQVELDTQIDQTLTKTRQQLLENFDDEVREKLRIRDQASKAYLNLFERLLMQLTQYELKGHAEFLSDSSFRLKSYPMASSIGEIPLGLYELPRRSGEANLYRLNHALAEAIIAKSKNRHLNPAEIRFDYNRHGSKISVLEPLLGKSGWLALSLLSVEALDQVEDRLLFGAFTDEGKVLEEEQIRRLFTLPGTASQNISVPSEMVTKLEAFAQDSQQVVQRSISERNARYFEAEATKLDDWAEDLKLGLEREIKDFDLQLRETRRSAITALTLEEKLEKQKQIKFIESMRNQKRRSLFEAQDQVDKRREELITQIEGKLIQKSNLQRQFIVRWRLI